MLIFTLEFSLYYVPSYRAFRQIKIRHIFIMQFGGYFVKFYSRQIFRPYGIWLVLDALITKSKNMNALKYVVPFKNNALGFRE